MKFTIEVDCTPEEAWHFFGHCQVVEEMVAPDRAGIASGRLTLHLDACLLAPDPEGLVTGSAVPRGSHQVPLRSEVTIDHGMGRQEALPAPVT